IFGTFIVAGHLFEGHRSLLCSESSTRRQADRADGAAVDRAFDTDLTRCFQQISGAGHVDVIEDRRIFRPQSIVGGDMVEVAAAGEGFSEGCRVTQIPCDSFDRKTVEVPVERRSEEHTSELQSLAY